MINPKNAPYNCNWDGTGDDTLGLQAAVAAALSSGQPLYFPAGIANVGMTDPNNRYVIQAMGPLRIVGDGAGLTTLRSIGPYAGFLDIQAGDFEIDGVTLDANGGLKHSIRGYSHTPIFRNVVVKNQTSESAIYLEGATQAILDNVQISDCVQGLELKNLAYPDVKRLVVGDCTAGPAVKMYGVQAGAFYSTYYEGSPGPSLDIDNCDDLHFYNLQSEFADVVPMTGEAYVRIKDSDSVHVYGGRMNHSGTPNTKLVSITGICDVVSLEKFYFITNASGMKMVHIHGTHDTITLKNILASGNGVGVECQSRVNNLVVKRWKSKGSITHTFEGYRAELAHINDNFYFDDGTVKGVINNCTGTLTGPGVSNASRIGS